MKNSLWDNISRDMEREQGPITAILKNVPIFRDLRTNELREIERLIHWRHFKPGEVIFWEGEPGMGMYIIQHGEVGIFQGRETSHEEELANLRDGDFFGEMALLSETPRSATAVALTDCEILGIFRPELLNVFEVKPRFAVKVLLKLAEIMSLRLRNTNQELQDLKVKFSKKEVLI